MKTEGFDQALARLESLVEKETGRSIEAIRNQPIDEDRKELEGRTGRMLSFPRKFPYVGRGCIMGDRAKSREEVDRLFEGALR